MARKKKEREKERGLLRHFDWSIDPQTTKEIISIVLYAAALVYVVGVFGGGGVAGARITSLGNDLFGVASFLIPIVFLALGFFIWQAREVSLRGLSLVGFVLLFVFIPALFLKAGGAVGQNVWGTFDSLFGAVAGYIVVVLLSVASVLLASNISIKKAKQWLSGAGGEEEEKESQTKEPAKVSVFQTVKNKIASRPFSASSEVKETDRQKVKIFDKSWKLPGLDLLVTSPTKAASGNITKNVETIQKTLRDFGISVTMGDVNIGPTVTQYTLKPSEGVKLTAITARSNDLALSLAAHPIRVEAPIPGKSAVGIEVPNKQSAIVTLKELLESSSIKKIPSTLKIPLGRDVSGTPVGADLKKMPHLLIAGATGSGKSVSINSIILSLLFHNSPADLRLILVDPKRVEFSYYNGVPHLLTPVVTEVDKTINTLRWTISEMERRYKLFAEFHKRNIEEYNAGSGSEEDHLPFIVVIIDELADIMSQSANEAEAAIVRIAQMARATGIHLILATQRPSVDVITGLIKANITARIAFAVASAVDSRTILDQAGAERLLGNGDMLYIGNEVGKPKRIQGALISDKDIAAVTDFVKKQSAPNYNEEIQDFRPRKTSGRHPEGEIDDDLFEEAKETVIQAGKASASLLQRRLRVGYARAARLLDLLEQEGIIGPPEGSKPRDILVTAEMAKEMEKTPTIYRDGSAASHNEQNGYNNIKTKDNDYD